MSGLGNLEELQSFHRDLLAFSAHRLTRVERLWDQLEVHIADFKRLLDKPPRNEQSRKSLTTGKLQIHDEEYAINDAFQQSALQLADALNLDEVESARVLFDAQGDAEISGRSILESSVIRFYQTQKYTLDCFRLVLQQSLEDDVDDKFKEIVQQSIRSIIQTSKKDEDRQNFVGKCLSSMKDVKLLLQDLAEKLNSASVLGQIPGPGIFETIEFQRVSLVQQHEALSVIVHYLIKVNCSAPQNFKQLLELLRCADKYDNLLVHSFLVLSTFISTFGAPEGPEWLSSLEEARTLNDQILSHKEQNPWTLHYAYSAACVWWLAEYSGRYIEQNTNLSLEDVNLDDESKARAKQFTDALKDGAFDFMLSLSADVKSPDWVDPARHGLRQWLQRKSPSIIADSVPFSDYFQDALMEQLESFIDAFITHMPDMLRKLRIDEDEQRQLSLTHDHDLDLERFLVMIAFAFEGRPDAAQAFWSDPDSNLAGFLQWASRRTTTPLLGAFCEMLQALSEDESCATKAHEFLLKEGTSSGKMMRSHSLTWDKIFRELKFYSSVIHDRPTLPQSNFYRSSKQNHDHAEVEPESVMMLESYLRLITRLCAESVAARNFVLQYPSFRITDLLYELSRSDNVPSRLRACTFFTLRSLLSHKTKERSKFIWESLDYWAFGSNLETSLPPRTAISNTATIRPLDGMLQRMAGGYEECTAFILLLQALVGPYEDDTGLNDALPFPEQLGSSNRMPGIDPYIDFVGQVFESKPAETNDPTQLRLLYLACLQFIATCLATFNEDLVIFANRSEVAVDNAIRTTDLESYMRLHPFSRIMEWIYNDGVMTALFTTLHQDIAEVGNSSPESPLVLCLLRAIDVATLVMDLQATYLDIVRPMMRLNTAHRRKSIANTTFSSFEDGVLNHLFLISDLGLYCSAGHASLSIASLKLLEILSTSSKIVGPSNSGISRYPSRNKAIAVLESDNNSDRIGRSLINEMMTRFELEEGPGSDAYLIKVHILDFLYACLEAVPASPSIAHLILGFQCGTDEIEVSHDSLFSNGTSLFHSILRFVIEYPLEDPAGGISSWQASLKYKAFQVLKSLWKSPLSCEYVMAELRANDFIMNMFSREIVLNPMTLWDGCTVDDEEFLSSSSIGVYDFIRHRATLLQYVALDFRRATEERPSAIKERALAALRGTSMLHGGQQLITPTVFDLFDFMEIDFRSYHIGPQLNYFRDIDFSICLETLRDSPPTYNLRRVEELITLRRNELQNTRQLLTTRDEPTFENEAMSLAEAVNLENRSLRLRASRLTALDAWVQVMIMIVETGGLDGSKKISFVLQALQIILPKLEIYTLEALDEALMLANLAKYLLFSIDFSQQSFQKSDLGDIATDRLFQLFRVCLGAIYSPIANPALREILYGVCYRYLTGVLDVLGDSGVLRKYSMSTIKAAGERLMNIICEDAYASGQNCRISALLLLGAIIVLAKLEDSQHIIDAMVRLNFIAVVVDSIHSMLAEIRECKLEDLRSQILYCESKLALLLYISETRAGANAIVNAGLFQSIKKSRIFLLDPDLYADAQGSESTRTHYSLLLALTKIINAALLSRGEHNEQTLALGRRFLSENRLSVITVFKRSVGLGLPDESVVDESTDELADSYILLITLTGFLNQLEDSKQPNSFVAFT